MNRIDLSERIANMFYKSRNDAGVSQDYIAKALGVSRKTVQNWESGEGTPNLRMALEWFEALGVPMYPYLMTLLYPNELKEITANTDMEAVRKALHIYVDELDDLHAKELLYCLHGQHGSSPTGSLDLLTAYLHLPLAMKICITDNMITTYEIAKTIGFLRNTDDALPEIETLKRFLNTAKEAVINGKESYTVVQSDDYNK